MIEKIERFANKWWSMLILISIPIFIALSPVLIGGYNFVDAESERFQQGFSFYKDSILKSDSTLLNPFSFSGFPNFVGLTGGFLNPVIYILLKFLPVVGVYNWLIFLYFVLAAFFMAKLLRFLKVSIAGSFLGGIVYTFSQWSQNHDITINSTLFLFPFLFLLLLKVKEKPSVWKTVLNIFLGSLAIGLTWFSAHWHFLVEIIFAGGLFAIFLGVTEFFKNKEIRKEKIKENFLLQSLKCIKLPLVYLMMLLGGTIIGAVQIIPTMVFIPLSLRLEQFSHWQAAQGGMHYYDLIGFLFPYFNYPLKELSSYFIDYWGILPIFLFIIAFKFKWWEWTVSWGLKELCFSIFFPFLFILGMFLSVNNSPVFWLIHHLPPINLLHEAGRWMILASFSLAALAAFGLDFLSENFESTRTNFKLKLTKAFFQWVSFVFIVISFSSSLIIYFFQNKILYFLNLYFDEHIYNASKLLPLDYYHNYIASLFHALIYSFYIFNPRFIVPYLFIFSGWLIIYLYQKGKIKRHFLIYLIVIVTCLNFSSVFYFKNNLGPKYILDVKPKTVEFLQNKESGRIFSVFRFKAIIDLADYGTSYDEAILKSELLFPNKNVPFQIESIDLEGDPMANKDMAKMTSYIGGVISMENTGKDKLENLKISITDKLKIFESRKPILDFLGVKYLLSPVPLNDKIFSKIFETRTTAKEIPVFIYENKEVRPLYYFTKEQWLIGINEHVSAEDLNKKLKASSLKYTTQNGAKMIERKNTLLKLKVDINEPNLLVFSQNNLPGWLAKIDGIRVPIYKIGGVYMGILVPSGQHEILFEYSYGEIWRYFFDLFLKNISIYNS